eukprot:1724626-Rhodomonas_salina.3
MPSLLDAYDPTHTALLVPSVPQALRLKGVFEAAVTGAIESETAVGGKGTRTRPAVAWIQPPLVPLEREHTTPATRTGSSSWKP